MDLDTKAQAIVAVLLSVAVVLTLVALFADCCGASHTMGASFKTPGGVNLGLSWTIDPNKQPDPAPEPFPEPDDKP
jgi:hypothetical protein